MWKVVLEKRAKKQLKKLPQADQQRIVMLIDSLATDPFVGKKLKGSHKGEYALRAWPYRIIYTIEKKRVTVYVLAIGHRQGVYK